MNPRLRKQLKEYEKYGFTVKNLEDARGSHVKVIFHEFSAPQFLTSHIDDPRALKNNIARFKRLSTRAAEAVCPKLLDGELQRAPWERPG